MLLSHEGQHPPHLFPCVLSRNALRSSATIKGHRQQTAVPHCHFCGMLHRRTHCACEIHPTECAMSLRMLLQHASARLRQTFSNHHRFASSASVPARLACCAAAMLFDGTQQLSFALTALPSAAPAQAPWQHASAPPCHAVLCWHKTRF